MKFLLAVFSLVCVSSASASTCKPDMSIENPEHREIRYKACLALVKLKKMKDQLRRQRQQIDALLSDARRQIENFEIPKAPAGVDPSSFESRMERERRQAKEAIDRLERDLKEIDEQRLRREIRKVLRKLRRSGKLRH